MLGEVLAEVTRSGVVESVHAGHLVLLNADGSILFQKGDPTLNIYSRSSLKSIGVDRWNLARKRSRRVSRC